MKRRYGIITFLIIVFMFLCFTAPVSADTGPKPSLTIKCRGFSENSYVTVLATVEKYGPNWSVDALDYEVREKEDPSYFERTGVGKEIYIAIAEEAQRLRQSGEELYFWGVVTPCEKDYLFGYWPPEEFKILVYSADTDTFILSDETYTRTVFKTVLYCEYENGAMAVSEISKSELSSTAVIARILLTILIEYAVGFAHIRYTNRSRLAVVLVNIATQLVLNVILSLTEFKYGYGMGMYYLILFAMEALILLTEWFIYSRVIPKEELPRPFAYALTANMLSLCWGLLMQNVMPRLFM